MTKRTRSLKRTVVVLSVVLVMLLGVAGTMAYLQDATDPVVNTFTPSDVNITLTESMPTDYTAKMVPGATIDKDPKVAVVAGSEACYVFVKVDAGNGVKLVADATAADYITYGMAEDWTLVPGQTNVYYIAVDAAIAEAGKEFPVLADNQVQVLPTVTKAMMETAKTAKPTLTFTAYAIQMNHLPTGTDVASAWALIDAD